MIKMRGKTTKKKTTTRLPTMDHDGDADDTKYTSSIRTIIKDYTALDDQIKQISREIKQLRTQHSEWGSTIKKYMKDKGVDTIQLSDGSKIVCKEREYKGSVNEAHIAEKLEVFFEEFFNDPQQTFEAVKTMMNMIYNERPISTGYSMTRVVPRGGVNSTGGNPTEESAGKKTGPRMSKSEAIQKYLSR